ncbi:peptide chain release factor N(5)-glutamine methyltransferase [Nocardia caishijiensis]|uniref:Release factor glutamine methyltransferase n=1 Tax=Nocardia caishijiensis TaxID=184756 RepID=A0ABQ6YRW8_9NOCA|nr:peptide chain release factor N(5)-glutamine methyltransferase [Nocardia caishijiensis]KAF0848562.1 release factor glutamine methyltransferase [Nocardia caishijiensis]
MSVPEAATERVPLRPLVVAAAGRLAEAGVGSPMFDAEMLAAHALGVDRMRLALIPMIDAETAGRIDHSVDQRATRIPLQHLIGTAPLGAVDLAVGPGVFVPRPETELLLAWALGYLESRRFAHAPIVVDLCTGSGALALAIAQARPDADVHAVELDPDALRWARRNADARIAAGDTPITLHSGDVTDPFVVEHLTARADLVVANPPYIPQDAVLDPEVADHDPHRALFGGPDGLDVIRGMVPTIARLLRPGGATAVEHDDTNGGGVAALLSAADLTDIAEHTDLADKPRFVTARRPSNT